jgi:hypothetical protein
MTARHPWSRRLRGSPSIAFWASTDLRFRPQPEPNVRLHRTGLQSVQTALRPLRPFQTVKLLLTAFLQPGSSWLRRYSWQTWVAPILTSN